MTKEVLPGLLCLALLGCGPGRDETQAVAAVMAQRLAAKPLFGDPRNPAQFQTNSLAFLQALKAINTSQCPADFREAWSDYVTIVERSSARFLTLVTNTVTPASGAPAAPASTNPPAPANSSASTSSVPVLHSPRGLSPEQAERIAQMEGRIAVFQNDIDKAWADLRRAANRYGVEPQR